MFPKEETPFAHGGENHWFFGRKLPMFHMGNRTTASAFGKGKFQSGASGMVGK